MAVPSILSDDIKRQMHGQISRNDEYKPFWHFRFGNSGTLAYLPSPLSKMTYGAKRVGRSAKLTFMTKRSL